MSDKMWPSGKDDALTAVRKNTTIQKEAAQRLRRLGTYSNEDYDKKRQEIDANATDSMKAEERLQSPAGYKKGGKVKKTGPAKVHKGEFVVKRSAASKNMKTLKKMNKGKFKPGVTVF